MLIFLFFRFFKLIMVEAAMARFVVKWCLFISSSCIVVAFSRFPPVSKNLSSMAFATSLIIVNFLDR